MNWENYMGDGKGRGKARKVMFCPVKAMRRCGRENEGERKYTWG